jgi:hypothetical protein
MFKKADGAKRIIRFMEYIIKTSYIKGCSVFYKNQKKNMEK